jgi:hypothetical protein
LVPTDAEEPLGQVALKILPPLLTKFEKGFLYDVSSGLDVSEETHGIAN